MNCSKQHVDVSRGEFIFIQMLQSSVYPNQAFQIDRYRTNWSLTWLKNTLRNNAKKYNENKMLIFVRGGGERN